MCGLKEKSLLCRVGCVFCFVFFFENISIHTRTFNKIILALYDVECSNFYFFTYICVYLPWCGWMNTFTCAFTHVLHVRVQKKVQQLIHEIILLVLIFSFSNVYAARAHRGFLFPLGISSENKQRVRCDTKSLPIKFFAFYTWFVCFI